MTDLDPKSDQYATDRVGLTKPMTADGWVDESDRFCELCHFAQTASYLAPEYRDGTAVCSTHADALEDGRWADESYAVDLLDDQDAEQTSGGQRDP